MNPTQFPHLTDTESVRREADAQYGSLNDAAAFLAAHKASLSVDVAAASLRRVDDEETKKVQKDLGIAQKLIDKQHGSGTFRVLDAVVRGDALSAVVEDQQGRTLHLVVGYNERWRSIAPEGGAAEEAINAQAEHARMRLGAEARAEIARQVDEATGKIMEQVAKLTGKRLDEVASIRDKALADTTGGEAKAEKKAKSDDDEAAGGDGGDDGEGEWPRRHDDLDAIAADNNVEFPARTNIDDKIAALEAAGVKPPPPEE